MSTVVEVKKNPNENNTNLLRRFSRRVQEAYILPVVKGKRYSKKKPSDLSRKTMALRKMSRRKEYEKLKKLGKLPQ